MAESAQVAVFPEPYDHASPALSDVECSLVGRKAEHMDVIIAPMLALAYQRPVT